jgi:hypothetical protein
MSKVIRLVLFAAKSSCRSKFRSHYWNWPVVGLNVVWFDAQNYQLVPEWTVVNNTGVSMQDIETESLKRLKELKEKEKATAEEEKRRKSLRRSLRTLWDQES